MSDSLHSRISTIRCDVVSETQSSPPASRTLVSTALFASKVVIQQTLVGAIPASAGTCKSAEVCERCDAWCEYKDTAVEGVWPACVWSGGKVCRKREEVRKWTLCRTKSQ